MPYVIISSEQYSRDKRALEGEIPSVRLKDCNVLVASLGADAERCKALTAKLAAFLETVE